MVKADKLLSAEQKTAVESAVTKAEKKTSGEIVVVLASKSGRYDRGEDIFGVLVGCLAVVVGWFSLQNVESAAGEWQSGWVPSFGLLPILGLFVGGFVAGAVIATFIPHVGLLFTPGKAQKNEVQRRATEAFFNFRVRKTEDGSGVLIYVSLFEHLVWVVGDDAINEKLGDSAWQDVRDRIVTGFKEKDPAAGLQGGIERCGEILAEHFPVKEGDVNELTNEVRILD